MFPSTYEIKQVLLQNFDLKLNFGSIYIDDISMIIDDLSILKNIRFYKDSFYLFNNVIEESSKRYKFDPRGLKINIDNGVDVMAYYGKLDHLYVNCELKRFIDENSPDYITVSVFNYNNNIPQYLKYDYDSVEIPDFRISVNTNVKYSYIKEKEFKILHNESISVSPISCLLTDIPFELYNQIQLTDNCYYYDADLKEFLSVEYDEPSIEQFVKEIYTNGIKNPVCLKINNGVIVNSVSRVIVVAKILKLPSIPAILYMCEDDFTVYENKYKTKINGLKEFCYPYLIWK